MDVSLPILGYNIWWGLRGTRVQRADLAARLAAAGFADHLPEPPTAGRALRRAIQEWVAHRSGGGGQADDDDEFVGGSGGGLGPRRELIRSLNSGRRGPAIMYALVAEAVDLRALGLHYATQARFQLEKLSPEERLQRQPRLLCTTEAVGIIEARTEAQQITDELRPIWAEYQDCYISSDLSRMMREIVDAIPGSVCVRAEGGLYFVPVDQHDTLLRLQQLVENLPTDGGRAAPYLELVSVPDEKEARRSMTRAIHRGFLQELEALDRSLDDLRSKAKAVRADTIAQRLVEYKQLRDRAQTYADLLGMQQSVIAEAVERLQVKARGLVLAGDDDEGEEEAPESTETRVSVPPAAPPAVEEQSATEAGEEPPAKKPRRPKK